MLNTVGVVRFVLGTGLLRRGDEVLLVRCRYEGEPEALWALPGGGQEAGESLASTVVREFREETSLVVAIGDLAYLSESIDPEAGLCVFNTTFWVRESDPTAQPRSADPKVVEARFVRIDEAPALLQADVVRIPVSTALSRSAHPHYFAFHSNDVRVPFFGRTQRKPEPT